MEVLSTAHDESTGPLAEAASSLAIKVEVVGDLRGHLRTSDQSLARALVAGDDFRCRVTTAERSLVQSNDLPGHTVEINVLSLEKVDPQGAWQTAVEEKDAAVSSLQASVQERDVAGSSQQTFVEGLDPSLIHIYSNTASFAAMTHQASYIGAVVVQPRQYLTVLVQYRNLARVQITSSKISTTKARRGMDTVILWDLYNIKKSFIDKSSSIVLIVTAMFD